MPAFMKHAWRYLVGVTGAAILFVAIPAGVDAKTLEICVNNAGHVKGVNVSGCPFTSLTWETVGPQGPQGPDGVQGNPGNEGPQGATGAPGIQGPQGAQGGFGATGPAGAAGAPGEAGPHGPMGDDGIKGIVGKQGPPGPQGVPGTNGFNEPNVSFLTGGTLGELGSMEGTELTFINTVNTILLDMGPGNGSDNSEAVQVPMSEGGVAADLWVNVDHHPGVDPLLGLPINYFFFLCNGTFNLANCGVSCVITDPDTTCNDPVPFLGADTQSFGQGDALSVFAFTDNINANPADVKWSTQYFHNKVALPVGP